jgi:phosphohistidine phosphatase
VRTLLILRHAKSSWADPSLADHDRPLNKRGRRDAPRMGALLREEGLIPGLMLSSTARRARQTAEAVAEESGYEGNVLFTRELYRAHPDSIVRLLRRQPDERLTIMVLGHNPGLEDLLEILTGERQRLPTAALAQVALPISRWEVLGLETSGSLANLWRPKEL